MSWWNRKEVWKLQKPLFDSTGGYDQVLAYTKAGGHDRDNALLIPTAPEQMAALFGDVDIIYAEAHLEDGTLVIDKRVKARNW